jgi:chromosome partitioning protein
VLDHVFIVVNSFNATFKLAKEALDALKQHYPEFLMPKVIRQCTRFAQASSEGMPIFRFDRDSKGAADVQELIDDVLARLQASTAARAAAQVQAKSA